MSFHVITLGVNDIQKSERFYVEWLGARVSVASNEHIKFLDLPGIKLALYGREALAQDACVPVQGIGFKGFTLAINVPRKEEVKERLDVAAELGGVLTKEAQDVFWGGHRGYVADPDGNLIEVAWNPFFAFAPDGSLELP